MLKKFRIDAGLSQQQLAESAGVTQGAIGHLERGRSKSTDLDTSRKIVAALNEAGVQCSLDDVFPPEQSVA